MRLILLLPRRTGDIERAERTLRHLVPTLALALAACAVPTVPTPSVPPPVSAAPTAPTGAPTGTLAYAWSPQLESAAQRLRGALRGAEVSQTTDQRLWISLPGADTFAPGRSAIKPPGGLWLDEVANALRGLPRADLQIVGNLEKGESGGTALALDRAASARDWMVMRGVAARRVAVSGQAPRPRVAAPENRLDILIGERTATPGGGSSSVAR
jgi:outer membrane protein OmpA-like peptidoglycan-associated protein